jgi:hydrogenase expression/formation protein
LLIIAPAEVAEDIMRTVRSAGVEISIIGKVEEGSGAMIMVDGELRDFTPRFRESAYTPIKKMIGEEQPRNFEEMQKAIDRAALEAIVKKKRIIEKVRSR